MKISEKKLEKKEKLLNAAYKLFIEKGIGDTTISDIVNEANVAKGTFYLYFENKNDIHEQLTISLSKEVFIEALNNMEKNNYDNFDQKFISIIDYIVDYLVSNKQLLKLISKDLSLGYYSDKLSVILEEDKIGFRDIFMKGIEENNIKLINPDVTLFMIIELISSSVYTIITKNNPLSIEDYKPYLYNAILSLIYTNSN